MGIIPLMIILLADLDEVEEGNKDETGEADPTFFAARDGESATDYSHRIFERVYSTDIKNVRKITVRPNSLSFRSFPNGLLILSWCAPDVLPRVVNDSLRQFTAPSNVSVESYGGFVSAQNLWSTRTPPDPLELSSILSNITNGNPNANSGLNHSNGSGSLSADTNGGLPAQTNHHHKVLR